MRASVQRTPGAVDPVTLRERAPSTESRTRFRAAVTNGRRGAREARRVFPACEAGSAEEEDALSARPVPPVVFPGCRPKSCCTRRPPAPYGPEDVSRPFGPGLALPCSAGAARPGIRPPGTPKVSLTPGRTRADQRPVRLSVRSSRSPPVDGAGLPWQPLDPSERIIFTFQLDLPPSPPWGGWRGTRRVG